MCHSNQYTYAYPDGRVEKSPLQTTFCSASRHGFPCANNVVYRYPPQPVTYAAMGSPSTPTHRPLSGQFPPTPTYSPRSVTPSYRSGDESDRSSSHRKRTHKAPAVYLNGRKMREASPSAGHGERVVLVNGPPTPSTPPRSYTTPHTAPSSPSTPYIVNASPRRNHSPSHHRPVTVDDRSAHVDIIDVDRRRHRHGRHGSASSLHRHSHHHSSHSGGESDSSTRRRRREQRDAEKQRDAERQQQKSIQDYEARMRERIASANANIASRPAVPVSPQPPLGRADTDPRRDTSLEDALRSLGISSGGGGGGAAAGKDREDAWGEDDEAQRRRLRERMMPRRRATVGPGSRRRREVYEEGVYRWE